MQDERIVFWLYLDKHAVVDLALVLVLERLVHGHQVAELGLGIGRVALVWVERQGEPSVGLPDVGGGAVRLELEELVEVGVDVLHHVVHLQFLLLEGRHHAAAAGRFRLVLWLESGRISWKEIIF